jgi:hypothetical protein
MEQAPEHPRLPRLGTLMLGSCLLITIGGAMVPHDSLHARQGGNDFPLVQLPPAFQIEKVADGLSFTAELAFDDQGRLYVAEAGGGFEPVEFRPPRILRVDLTNGQTDVVANLTAFVVPPVVGLAWDNGWLYFTHRDFDDTGALSRVRDIGGAPEKLLTGFVSAQSEHFMNGIEIRDGWVYFGIGQAGNSGVLGADVAPFIERNPGVRQVACRGLVMRGHNFLGPNVLGDERSTEPVPMRAPVSETRFLRYTSLFTSFGTLVSYPFSPTNSSPCGLNASPIGCRMPNATISERRLGVIRLEPVHGAAAFLLPPE